eukprot:CAMPEP_0194367510 /NCGR_PEP_ID=MMETSP0174-20130528/15604_1 /TAXON_ID=216777 /ORGANISM="Proboscia alata, Strain PI-D3" /LENGTH=535 /DNA_ID=CAMNT_0039143305 /DNA_START=83 /DNA_END=1690 /DNA_ORIENTATION=+
MASNHINNRMSLKRKHSDKKYYTYNGENDTNVPRDVEVVIFGTNVTGIGKRAFGACHKLTSLTMPDTIIVVKDQAFSLCDKIVELRISILLQIVGIESFHGCSSLRVLRIPPNLHTIMREGFSNCDSMEAIIPLQQGALLSLKTIEEKAFWNCYLLKNIPHLPSLEIIGPLAFGNCDSLTEVTLGPSIVSAARNCFNDCPRLTVLRCTYKTGVILPLATTHITVDPNTANISNSAFAGFIRLHSIVITPSVTRLGHSSFWGCQSLSTTFAVPDSGLRVGIGSFARCPQVTRIGNLPPHAIQDVYTFMGGEGEFPPVDITNLVIDDSVENIGPGMFTSCSELTSASFLSSEICIEEGAFNCCHFLEDVTFEANARVTIKKDAFANCLSLDICIMPNIVQWITQGDYVRNTSSAERLLPPTVLIYPHAFRGCPNSIINEFDRYQTLQLSWRWVQIMEQLNKYIQECGYEQMVPILEKIGINLSRLNQVDIDLLSETFSMKPSPPNDVADLILNHLHRYNTILKKLPRDLVRNVVEYL